MTRVRTTRRPEVCPSLTSQQSRVQRFYPTQVTSTMVNTLAQSNLPWCFTFGSWGQTPSPPDPKPPCTTRARYTLCMSDSLSAKLGVMLAVLLTGSIIFLSGRVAAQAACPTGQQPATSADLAAMRATGISNAAVGECWDPNDTNIGQAAAQAKQDLSGMTCGSGVDITNLDGKFAVCADSFMKALRQQSPGACIRSGYRSVQQQLAACMSICGASSCPGLCAPPGYSYHQKGLAIDVNYKISNSQAWQIAVSSTNSGVINPNGLHRSDPNHFQANSNSCAGAPVQQLVPTDYYSSSPNAQTFFTPTNSNSAIPAGYCLVNTQPILYAPCGTSQTQYAPIVQTATQPLQTNSAAAQSTAPASSVSASLVSATNTFSNIAQSLNLLSTSTAASHVFDILTNLTAAATSTSLNPDLNTIVQIRPGTETTNEQATSTIENSSLAVQQTFDANENSNLSTSVSSSAFSQILSSLSAILSGLLSYLRSLGQY